MRSAKIRKVKRILALFIIITTMIVLNFIPFNLISQHLLPEADSPEKIQFLDGLETADYSSSYSNTGSNFDVILHQSYLNNSYNIMLNVSDTNNNTFSIPSPLYPNFNSSYAQFEVDNIYAPNKTLIVEDDLSGGNMLGSGLNSHYISFETIGIGYIETINLSLKESGGGATLTIYLFNATNNLGNIEPDSAVYGTPIVNVAPITGSTYQWYNFTGINSLFNSSKTYNNTFFFRLDEGGLGTIQVGGAWDTTISPDLDDESLVYRSDGTTLETSAGFTVDAGLMLELSPLDNNPTPEQITLKINSSSIVGGGINNGSWVDYSEYQDNSGKLSFEVTADWWDVSCNIANTLINYTRTDLRASTSFQIPGSGLDVVWNVTKNGGLNYFGKDFSDYRINFTIPATWHSGSIKVFNGTDQFTINKRLLSNGYREVEVPNAINGSYWFLNATSDNEIASIETTPISIFNFSDIVQFNATFLNYTKDGTINLSVYSPAAINNRMNYTFTNNSFGAGIEVYFGDWNISETVTKYGIFRMQVAWNNKTSAGFREGTIIINAETSLQILYPSQNVNYNASKIFDILLAL